MDDHGAIPSPGPCNGNEGGKYHVVPRTPTVSPLVYAYFVGPEAKRVIYLWDHFRCVVAPSPGHTRCQQKSPFLSNAGLFVVGVNFVSTAVFANGRILGFLFVNYFCVILYRSGSAVKYLP